MIDFTKKVRTRVADSFEPGEDIRVAVVVQPGGTAMRGAIATGVGGALGAGLSSLAGRGGAGEVPEGSWATAFPTRKAFLTVTDRRIVLHSFSEMTGRPKDLLASFPLDVVASVQFSKGKLVHKATLTFVDGSAVPMDVMKGGDVEAMAHAIGGPTPTPSA